MSIDSDLNKTVSCWQWNRNLNMVFICCPNGHIGHLKNYVIDSDGNVEPVYECLSSGCGWKEPVTLDDYNGEPHIFWSLKLDRR